MGQRSFAVNLHSNVYDIILKNFGIFRKFQEEKFDFELMKNCYF